MVKLSASTSLVLAAAAHFSSSSSAVADSLDDIEHVIIFMQENRAFDHYFGSMKGVRGFNDRNTQPMTSGLPNSFYQPVDQEDLSLYMLPFHVDSHSTSAMCMDAPQMNYEADMRMWNNGKFDSWNTGRDPGTGMSYFQREDLPYYYALYDNFAMADQYYQSTFTATNPNRMLFFTGSNGLSVSEMNLDSDDDNNQGLMGGDDHGDVDDYTEKHNNCVLDNTEPRPGYNWTTIAEIFEEEQISWKVYQEIDNFDDNGFAWFANFQKSRPGDALFDKGMMRMKSLVDELDKDMTEGTLPQVSYLIAPTHLSEHASHHPAAGEAYTSQILDVLRKHPDVYAKSVFILNYDEGGQYYDHHWSPTPPIDDVTGDGSGGQATMGVVGEINTEVKTEVPAPIGLGFRVPLLVVSPWTRGNIVVSETFDHTSVLQFLEIKFNITCPNISPWRRSITGDLMSFFDFESPADFTWPELPDTTEYRKEAIEDCFLPYPEIPAAQTYPVQEIGTRISRALDYTFEVHDYVVSSRLEIEISNKGKNGAAFSLFDVLKLQTDVAVKQYAVEGGKSINESLPIDSEYHFILLGPNGFTREYVSSKKIAEHGTTLAFDVSTKSLLLTIENSNQDDLDFVLCNNAYFEYYAVPSTIYTVPAAGSTVIAIDIASAGNWYDFVLNRGSSCGDTSINSRRFAGHMETGVDSISDPAMGFISSAKNKMAHPEVPLRFRRLEKSKGLNITTAGQKDAVWIYSSADEL